ncbi:MAG TPA: AmmeMemoRadiSam system protein B [Candidatus Gastranaerophilaceae bacterium]|nr:AmmeMemoRadiSam system protein B [Candidatus Gastranaerophilaceae bacterium]HPT41880.1 AmmeMemoRadiSam system protein B [Candidatus Gastranaerophilaceae bacterium]
MEKIKQPSVAGKFYTNNKNELVSQLNQFKSNCMGDYKYQSRAVIVPHAGYVYSGQLAYEGISCISKTAKNIFIFAPSHYVGFDGLALSSFDKWLTPLGEISVNQEINKEIKEKFSAEFFDEAFVSEHSAEVQVPFIQTLLNDVNIVPILIGRENCEKVSEIVEYFWQKPDNAFVFSSDLSHFLNIKDAQKIDNLTAEMIETKDIEQFNSSQACGAVGICALVRFAQRNGFSLVRIGLTNSGEVTGDTSSVVGYGSWMLYEGEKNSFIKEFFSPIIKDICAKSILARLKKQKEVRFKYPKVLDEKGACFVTLEKGDNLRGCIGSIIAHKPLIEDLISNAQNAAFSDPRFNPLREDEFDNLSIAVSLLSTPEKMFFKNENDLLSQIKPFVDGIIIKDGYHQAVYLPSVWEQLPEKSDFLNSLKVKAGLSANYFSNKFEAYRFYSEYIK